MSDDFDWTGAPEGERWEYRNNGGHVRNRYVITNDEETGRETAMLWNGRWVRSLQDVKPIRHYGSRVDEPARPVVRVGDRVRVTVEGTVLDAEADGLTGGDDFEISVSGDGRRFFWPSRDGSVVEVLQRADPPLESGDLVRDYRGYLFSYLGRDRQDPFMFIRPEDNTDMLCAGDSFGRSDLSGSLVKVELREVTS